LVVGSRAARARECFADGCEDEIRILKEKIRHLTQVKISLEKDLEFYRNEINKLLAPPHIEAVVLEVLDSERVVVKSTSGPNLIVRVASNVSVKELKPGTYVALNNRGSTIVGVLPGRVDPTVKAMEIDERPNVSFRDVGGLEDQIRELYEVVVLPLKDPQLFRELA